MTAADAILIPMHAYEQCVKTTTLRLGANNHEPGDTVVAAAQSECQPQFEQFRTAIQIDQSAFFVRNRVTGEAMAVLLESRAKRP